MGGGGGSRSGSGQTTVTQTPDPEAQALMKLIRTEAIEKILPVLSGQVLEALKTGGVGAQIPLIQRSVEASRGATASALRQTGEELTRTGQAGTPFGQSTLANLRLAGETDTAQIPTDLAQQFLQIAPALSVGAAGQILPGFAGAGRSSTTQGARTSGDPDQTLAAVLGLVGTVAGAYLGGPGGAAVGGGAGKAAANAGGKK